MADHGRMLRAALAPIQRRIAMIAARALVNLIKDDQGRQRLQLEILNGELRDDVERFQDYGFTSHPKPGCDAAVVSIAGARGQAIALVVDDRRFRLQLQEGEVAIYDDLGNSVELLRDSVKINAVTLAEVIAPTLHIQADQTTIDGTSVTINADVTVNGNSDFTGTVQANGKSIDDTHTHGGVQAGSGHTGAPD